MTDRPAIKPLEWGKTSYGTPEANSVAGVYRINSAHNGGWSVVFKTDVLRDSDGRTNFATVEAAKAAAQADYASRIRSCLIDKPEAGEAESIERIVALEEALKTTLASLVATTSLIIRAEDLKVKPSKAVASDKMFTQMLKDYDKATIAGRAALAPDEGE